MEPMTGMRYSATAPIRICDLGGWTDTWFAGHGAVCSIAVEPGVRATLVLTERAGTTAQVTLVAQNYGESLPFPSQTHHHPHLHAALQTYPIPPQWDAVLTVYSEIPPGASTGTSAALCVAVIGVLRAARAESTDPATIARLAHALEAVTLGWQSGVQDQCGAAYGGCSWIEMPVYPQTTVRPIAIDAATESALATRLLLFYIGTPHLSHDIHRQVIERFERVPAAAELLVPLRRAAAAGRDALAAGDLVAYGQALQANTAAQRALHPALVSPATEAVIAAALAHGALGCKVNGAGGDGGSVAILAGADPTTHTALRAAVAAAVPHGRFVAVRYAKHGFVVETTTE